jgi:azurin
LKKLTVRIGLVFAIFIVTSSFFVVGTVNAEVQADTSVTIKAVTGTKFDKTLISLDKDTEYNFTFVNDLLGESHNFWILKPDTYFTASDVQSAATELKLGPAADTYNEPGTESGRFFSGNWTTPNEDVWVMFGCTFTGHFETMQGWLKIGNPEDSAKPAAASPGFELIVGIIAFLGLAIYRLRKN